MRRLLLRPGLSVSLIACAVVGCQHDRNCPTCGRASQASVASSAPALVMPMSTYAALPAGPVVHETLKPSVTAHAEKTDNPEWQTVSAKFHEKLSDRRTFTDVTANPAFAHAPDYTWLVGELRSMAPGVWTVRFASVDEERDTVVLVDAPPMIDMHTGQLVRVEGQLVDPSSHEPRPTYRVNAIRAVEHN